jgi:hypothetical protein
MMKLRSVCVFLLILLSGLGAPFAATTAQTALPTPASVTATLIADQPLQVTLAGAPLDLAYQGARGEVITLSAHSLNAALGLDTTLELLGADGVRLGFNDDMTGTRSGLNLLDSVIPSIELPIDGTYIVRVSSFDAAVGGPVEVLVSRQAGAEVATPGVEAVTVFEGRVTADAEDCTPLELAAAETLTAVVHALDNDLDTMLTLRGPDGGDLAFNDDHSLPDPALLRFDSAIEGFLTPADGDYQLCVSGFGGSSGPYTLTVTRMSNSATAVPTPETGNVSDLQTVTDRVPDSDQFILPVQWQAGDVYTLTARALDPDFDPQMGIFPDRSDELLAGNDDHSTSSSDLAFFDSRITNFIVPASGRFDIVIGGYQGSGGPFELTIRRTGENAPLGPPVTETVSGTVAPNAVFTHEVELDAGAYVTIRVAAAGASTLDSQVTLITPDGVIAADNDDHTSGDPTLGPTDSLIRNFFAAQAGVYTVEVRGYPGSSGTFTLTLETLQ